MVRRASGPGPPGRGCLRRGHALSQSPAQAQAIVVGDGSFLTKPTKVTIVGATLSGRGSSVAHGRVLAGFRLVIACDEGEIITSRVRAISVDGMPWFSEYHEA